MVTTGYSNLMFYKFSWQPNVVELGSCPMEMVGICTGKFRNSRILEKV